MEKHDINILRELARKYYEICSQDIQNERRRLWRQHNSLEKTRPMVLCLWWCAVGEIIEPQLQCLEPFYRNHERFLRTMIFQGYLEDDFVCEPWITQRAIFVKPHDGDWGLSVEREHSGMVGGAWKETSPINELENVDKMVFPSHLIDEKQTEHDVQKLNDAIGDILVVNVNRSPAYMDIANRLSAFRGLDQLMLDMYDNEEWLHKLLSFMRDGILKTHEEAENAGDWHLCNHNSYSVPYEKSLLPPRANSESVKRKDLWMAFNAQELTLVSPQMHDTFMLQYQIPIMKKFALTHYGCCEDLTYKIDILRKVPNLRRIAVTPWADLSKCTEQIKNDYILSWHPNPTDMGCCGYDEGKIRDVIENGLRVTKGCHVDIVFKDVQTVEGDPERLRSWTRLVKSIAEKNA